MAQPVGLSLLKIGEPNTRSAEEYLLTGTHAMKKEAFGGQRKKTNDELLQLVRF